jgi:radical SAM superfamily enzyme with C-terminal helix-hairpin-helix motif
MDKKLVKTCPICGGETTTSICSFCAENVEFLGVKPPDPNATLEEVRAWAKEHGVTSFRCGVK